MVVKMNTPCLGQDSFHFRKSSGSQRQTVRISEGIKIDLETYGHTIFLVCSLTLSPKPGVKVLAGSMCLSVQ